MTQPLPVLETACTDEALRAVRVLVDAYRLTADSRDADRILNGILDCVARLVDYDSAAVYVLGSSGRHVRHFWWRDESGAVPCHDGALDEGRPVARATPDRYPPRSASRMLTRRFCRPFFSILPSRTVPISAVDRTCVPPQGCRSMGVTPSPMRTRRTRP